MTGHWVWQAVGWLALALNVWGNLRLTSKGSAGWMIRLASNACWIVYSVDTAAWALLANHVLFAGINVYGWRRWNGERRREADLTAELQRIRFILTRLREYAAKAEDWPTESALAEALRE